MRSQLYKCQFIPTKPPNTDDDEPFVVSARAMGMVYGSQLTDEYYQDLLFPLLDTFKAKLLEKDETKPDKIILIMTNQETVFDDDDRRLEKSPYWQDTYTLKPIFEQYFQKNFPKVTEAKLINYLELKPEFKNEGLDNWDKTLVLVQQEFSALKFDKDATIYVSHQAGTPAISSAVQFMSLARFGERVKFLVSNEYDKTPLDPIDSSEYLRGIKFQEATALLKRHDYSGVKELLNSYLTPEIQILLDAAIQWNFAKFEDFGNEIKSSLFQELTKEVEKRTEENWWWTAYETAYLGVIRLKQENAVEAFFHSFRSVEGLISKWAESCFSVHVEPNNDSPLLKISILDVFPNYLGKKDQAKLKAEFEQKTTLILSGFPLYALLRADRPMWKQECKDITIFIDKISPRRNKLFHRLKGLQKDDVFQEWQVNSREEWEARILHYLNFVAKKTFSSLEQASLMSKVHQELEKAIANYELTP
ncbi:MAG: hypothetical protein WBG73_23285 [Coleofasciculaceae cyanobacterium]